MQPQMALDKLMVVKAKFKNSQVQYQLFRRQLRRCWILHHCGDQLQVLVLTEF